MRKLKRALTEQGRAAIAEILSSAHAWESLRGHYHEERGDTDQAALARASAEDYGCTLAEHLAKFADV